MDARELLKSFMRSVSQPVFAVTARGPGGYAAFTASSVTSISLEPPLMMVSVAKGSRSHDPLVGSEYFVITLLSCEERYVAEKLAERGDPKAKLEAVGYTESSYGPIVPGKARLYLKRYAVYEGGDHSIVLGEIVGGEVPEEPVKEPLSYHNRRYVTTSSQCS